MTEPPAMLVWLGFPKILRRFDWKHVVNKEYRLNVRALEQPIYMCAIFQWKMARIDVSGAIRGVVPQRSPSAHNILRQHRNKGEPGAVCVPYDSTAGGSWPQKPLHNRLVEVVPIVAELAPMTLKVTNDVARHRGRKQFWPHDRPEQDIIRVRVPAREIPRQSQVNSIDTIRRIVENARHEPCNVIDDGPA